MKKSAVVIPVFDIDNKKEGILLTRRSRDLPRHAGEISFPGGREEPRDKNLVDTALRELEEEIGLPRKEVKITGELEKTSTTTGYSIQPFIGKVPYPYPFEARDREVEAFLFAPIEKLIESHEKRDERNFFYYQNEEIWGATARIFIKFLQKSDSEAKKSLFY